MVQSILRILGNPWRKHRQGKRRFVLLCVFWGVLWLADDLWAVTAINLLSAPNSVRVEQTVAIYLPLIADSAYTPTPTASPVMSPQTPTPCPTDTIQIADGCATMTPTFTPIPTVTLTPTGTETPTGTPDAGAVRAEQHLGQVMDKYHQTFDVYTDVSDPGNHFVHRARLGSDVTLQDAYTHTVHSGATAIRNTFTAHGSNWGGWYFQNGVLLAADKAPRDNWGTYPDAGFDLTGAMALTFWARGEQGGERVEFFTFGIGRDPITGVANQPYPDAEAKVTLCGRLISPCFVTLADSWQPYTITLAMTNVNLSYIIGGFGWVTNSPQNNGRDITFYLDNIRYTKPHLNHLRFLVSYETIPSTQAFDTVLRNVAFTYDNALALIAFVNSQNWERAKLLADAFVHALTHDRYYTDGRLRNAYQAGDLIVPPGWKPNGRDETARLPGWWDAAQGHWVEDERFVGTDTGNMAWALIALLNYYEARGGDAYLTAAITLGNWIEAHARDSRGAGGYTGGYVGWEPTPAKVFWKSTEHNLDLYVAFERLSQITQQREWHTRAEAARTFVEAMWNAPEGYYWTGVLTDGVSINQQAIPLDAQTWALLAFGPNERTHLAIDFAQSHHHATLGAYSGFDFDTDQDMPWSEGTGQMSVVYQQLGNQVQAAVYLDELHKVQTTAPNHNGFGIVAAPADGLTTGFGWQYYNRLHVGATAWYLLACNGFNPYWPGQAPPLVFNAVVEP